MLALADEEARILSRFNSAVGEDFTDDQTLLAVLEEITPQLNEYILKVEAINPPSDCRSSHEKYIRALGLYSSAFLIFQQAMRDGDTTLVAEGNEKVADARRLIREFTTEVEEKR